MAHFEISGWRVAPAEVGARDAGRRQSPSPEVSAVESRHRRRNLSWGSRVAPGALMRPCAKLGVGSPDHQWRHADTEGRCARTHWQTRPEVLRYPQSNSCMRTNMYRDVKACLWADRRARRRTAWRSRGRSLDALCPYAAAVFTPPIAAWPVDAKACLVASCWVRSRVAVGRFPRAVRRALVLSSPSALKVPRSAFGLFFFYCMFLLCRFCGNR